MPCLPRMVSLIGMACWWWGIPFCANVTSAWLCAFVAGVDVDPADEPAELVPLVADLLPELLHAVMVTRAASAATPISTHRLITSSPSAMPPLPLIPTLALYILCRYVGHRWQWALAVCAQIGVGACGSGYDRAQQARIVTVRGG